MSASRNQPNNETKLIQYISNANNMEHDDLHNFIHICESVPDEPVQKITILGPPGKKRAVSGVPRNRTNAVKEKNTEVLKNALVSRRKQEQATLQALQDAVPVAPRNQPSIVKEQKTEVLKNASVSRRKQHQATLDALQDAPQRANYMATYHAKPYELDRRSEAIHPSIPQSHDSQHLFRDAEISSKSSIQTPTCPFEACNIHPRIIRAITSNPKCNLLLSRPTIIQQNTWNHILQHFPFSTQNGSHCKYNYFIQSETGSGKTLAYLVPILQSIAQRNSIKPSISTNSPDVQPKENDRQNSLTAIIVCPTRELTVQTGDLVHTLCMHSFSWMVSGTLSGGEKRKTEKALLRRGVHILVSSPGRLLDHLHKTNSLLLSLQKFSLKWLVLDETDRLLMDGMSHVDISTMDNTTPTSGSGGLQKQVQEILQIIRHQGTHSWQSILVSATISDRLQSLAKKILSSSVSDQWIYCSATLQSGIEDEKGSTNGKNAQNQQPLDKDQSPIASGGLTRNENEHTLNQFTESTPQQLTQSFMVVSMKLRLPALIAFLTTRISHGERLVVFMATCDAVDFYSNLLQSVPCIMKETKSHGAPVTSTDDGNHSTGIFGAKCPIYRLHGNVAHHERQKIVKQFSDTSATASSTMRKKNPAILFATDVAARGLNFPSIDWIIQYDPPCETSDYVHRAGRAARAGKAGHALLFLLPTEQQYIEILKKRGLSDMTALSLSSTLESASKLCPDVTSEGVKRSGGNSSRRGESFANAIQNRMEDWIVDDDRVHKESLLAQATKLTQSLEKRSQKRKEKRQAQNAIGLFLEKARKAYFAFIQSYPTREKALKHIFSPRALHLGHVARSFALKEVPTSITKAARQKIRSDDPGKSGDNIGKKRSNKLAFEQKEDSSTKKRKLND